MLQAARVAACASRSSKPGLCRAPPNSHPYLDAGAQQVKHARIHLSHGLPPFAAGLHGAVLQHAHTSVPACSWSQHRGCGRVAV